MLILGLVAIGVALRPRRWWEALALAAPVVLPLWAGLAGIAAGIWVALRRSRPDPYQEVAYLQAVSAELQAGRSLRQALVDAGTRAPDLDLARMARLCRSGRPMLEVARAAGSAARASVAVLAVLPAGGLFAAAATGTLSDLMAMGTVGPILVGIGTVLLIAGASVTLILGRQLS